jgi:hypothetical protein
MLLTDVFQLLFTKYAILHSNHSQMPKYHFSTERKLSRLIDGYFELVAQAGDPAGESITDSKPSSAKTKKIHNVAEPPTITGLALHLGFNSLREFDDYEIDGEFADTLRRGRLRIEAAYEKKLHLHQPHTGVIFALKSMGWGEKKDDSSGNKRQILNLVKIEIIKLESTPKLASAEDEVIL